MSNQQITFYKKLKAVEKIINIPSYAKVREFSLLIDKLNEKENCSYISAIERTNTSSHFSIDNQNR